ncbi:1624_t:CDS:2 [Paraglomus occultum]|uniref:1624_t:CDS:1 n=1 Tax=Paraglomus occultum TaxID=144539 RepID=A0A9N8VJC0_9GLOM|nr:1624_t:CDS:2 [Paraglomus occultum]
MFTRRRKSSSDASLLSPKRIRVNEASEDGTYPPCLPSIPCTFTPLPLTPGPQDDNLTDPEYLSYNTDNTFTKSDTNAPTNRSHGTDVPTNSTDNSSNEYSSVEDTIVPGALLLQTDSDATPLLTEEEYLSLRRAAQKKGTANFIKEYLFDKAMPITHLLYAFDAQPPQNLVNASDIQLIPILHKAVSKFLRHRKKLDHINTLEDVVRLLKESKNIMVLTGAGVSVSCGIPDFRSENGIYSRLSEFELDDPQDMFDINYFKERPKVFYSFAKKIYPSNFKPSPSHYFIKLLEDKQKLLRNYTQNIDTLEQSANINNILQCHGSFARATCVKCGYKVDGHMIKDDILNSRVPYCPRCPQNMSPNHNPALMKPDIVFFGEKLPDEFDHFFPLDREKVDLLIVMGSSLRVAPVSEIMGQIPHDVPQIVINKTPIGHMEFDVQLLGDCDTIVAELCRLCGWELKHEKLPNGSSNNCTDAKFEFLKPCWYLFEGAQVLPDEDACRYV